MGSSRRSLLFFVPYIFFRPFRLSLAPFICPWVSEDVPELGPKHIQDYDLRKRAKYLSKCEDALWSRWTKEYLRGLRERHRLKCKGDSTHPAKGDVVIIKSDDKNRAQWKLGVVIDLITGRDGVVRGAKLRTCCRSSYPGTCTNGWWKLERLLSSFIYAILALLTDQFKMPSKTFALSRQMRGECWKNGRRDCHAVKVNFIPLI